MSYTVALLFTLIGTYEEMTTVSVADPALGAAHFTSYGGYTGKCAVRFNEAGGEVDAYVSVTSNIDDAINPHYGGVSGENLVRADYSTLVAPAHYKGGFGDYVLLKESSDFTVVFETRDLKTRVTKVVSCDIKSCTCAPKL
jgi:hypothetical protein